MGLKCCSIIAVIGKSNQESKACTKVGLKEAKSATMNIFRKKLFCFQIICKSRIKLCFHNKSVH